MSVYIKGMEMPSNCNDCPLNYDSIDCMVADIALREKGGGDFLYEHERASKCPLIELPPHGGLIEEADAIETAWLILRGLGYFKEENPQLEQTVREVFATAPAIEVE